MPKITKTFVDSVPLSDGKQVIYRDSELTGFALRVTKTKSYVAEKKLPDGTTCRVTIGQHGVWTVAQAREQAKEYLLMISKGENPNKHKKDHIQTFKNDKEKNNQVPTVEEAYLLYKSRKKLANTSITAYDMCVNDYFEDWKTKKITAITQKMAQERFAILTERSPAQANLALKFLRALFNFSAIHYLTNDDEQIINTVNPASFISRKKALNKIKRRRTYVRSDQHRDWAYAVATTAWARQQSNNMHGYTNQDYLFLLVLTGFRRNEGETIEWSKIDLKYGTITIVDTKNGEDLMLPMGEMLWHIMKERKKRAGDSKYVFPDKTGKSHISDRRNAREKVIEDSGISFTFHDLRRTFSSVANSIAVGQYTIKRLLNHTFDDDDQDVTDGYVQVSFQELQKAMNMIEEVLIHSDVREIIYNRKYENKLL